MRPPPALRRRVRAALVAAGCLLVSASGGCYSLGLDAPQLTPPGQHRVDLGAELVIGTSRISPTDQVSLPSLALVGGYRHGFEDWDLGVRVWGLGLPQWYGVGAGVDVRYGFVTKPPTAEGLAVTGRLSVNYHQVTLGGMPAHLPSADLTVSFGHRFGFGHQIYGAVRGHMYLLTGHDINLQILGAAVASIGWEAAFGKGRRWAVIPQVGVGYMPVSWNGTLDDPDRNGLGFVQLTLGARVHL